MKRITEEETKKILEARSEDLNLEFKDGFDYKKDFPRERLIRAILAMSNTRSGGDIIIGIKEVNRRIKFSGLKEKHLSEMKEKEEDLKSKVESFSNQPIGYKILEGSMDNKSFIIIRVPEFDRYLSICRKSGTEHKNGSRILERGSIYIRALKDKPSSVKIVDPADVQDLIDRTVDKNNKKLTERGYVYKKKTIINPDNFYNEENKNF